MIPSLHALLSADLIRRLLCKGTPPDNIYWPTTP